MANWNKRPKHQHSGWYSEHWPSIFTRKTGQFTSKKNIWCSSTSHGSGYLFPINCETDPGSLWNQNQTWKPNPSIISTDDTLNWPGINIWQMQTKTYCTTNGSINAENLSIAWEKLTKSNMAAPMWTYFSVCCLLANALIVLLPSRYR